MCVKVNTPFFFCSKNNGITDPLLPETLPYLTTENFGPLFDEILLAAKNNLSEHNFVAPYKFVGDDALSVDNAITFFTLLLILALMTLLDPIILVLINSKGLYSANGTCFNAAACTT